MKHHPIAREALSGVLWLAAGLALFLLITHGVMIAFDLYPATPDFKIP